MEILGDRLARLDTLLQRHLIESARYFQPDVLISCDRRIQPDVLREIKHGGARAALWFPDHVANLGRHDVFLAPYDKFFFKNPQLVDQLMNVHGLPVGYLPEAANSHWHRATDPYGIDPSVVVAGNIHPTRGILLERLAAEGLPLRIFGPRPARWMDFPAVSGAHTGLRVTRHAKASVFRRARLVLNNLHPAELAGSNCRLFEATACGAVVLTERREGLEDLFVPGEEVLTFASFEELTRLSRQLLNSPEFGQQIADRAAMRAHTEHTYEKRLEHMLSALE